MTQRRFFLFFALVLSLLATPDRVTGLDKEAKKWLDGVVPLMLADERKMYEGLKDKNDVIEFQKIFWARRDPDLNTPENEYQGQYETAFADADKKFKVRGRSGAQTDCGRIFILLGEPTEVKKDQPGPPAEPGLRTPETWVYKGEKFAGGQALIGFNEECMGPDREEFKTQTDRLAATRILHPNIGYRHGKDGRLTKLVDLLPKPTPAQALLKEPRQDFPVGAQASFLKVMDGGSALIGLVRGEGVEDAAGKKMLRLVICAQAEDETGKVAAFAEQETNAEVSADGSFLASYRMSLQPGRYTVKAGALEPKSGKGSLTSIPVEVPDFNKGELGATLIVLRDVEELANPDTAEPDHPYAAFALAKARLIPRFGTAFAKAETVSFFYQFYDAKLDEQSKKASVVASVAILKGAAPQARAPDQPYETVVGGTIVGPIPLTSYAAGSYKVQLKLVDNVAKKEIMQELPFEVK
jgi:GWxTD domain-containing protein